MTKLLDGGMKTGEMYMVGGGRRCGYSIMQREEEMLNLCHLLTTHIENKVLKKYAEDKLKEWEKHND